MVTVLVDTSALIALLDEDDPRHREAVRQLQTLRASGDLVTTNYIQLETLAVARRRLGRDAETRLLDTFFPLIRVVWIDPGKHAVAVAAYRASGSAASLVDQVSFAVMRSEGITVAFAYDKDFAREGFASTLMKADDPAHRVNDAAVVYGTDVMSDLVSVSEIAQRANRSINTVQSWRRRHADFPVPVAQLAAGPIWNWSKIDTWMAYRSIATRRRDPPSSRVR